jgi:hypothetical protein
MHYRLRVKETARPFSSRNAAMVDQFRLRWRAPRIRSTIRSMTPRQFRIGGIVLSAAIAGLGIWTLAEAKYGTGAFWLVMSVAWMLLALHPAGAERRRQRLEASTRHDRSQRSRTTLPVGAARITDNPPGWYLNPATNEPAYWSEIGWRTKEPSPT